MPVGHAVTATSERPPVAEVAAAGAGGGGRGVADRVLHQGDDLVRA